MTRQNSMPRGGVYATSKKCATQFCFPEFQNKKGAELKPMVNSVTNPADTHCDMTVGGDKMSELDVDIGHLLSFVEWGKDGHSGSIPMKT